MAKSKKPIYREREAAWELYYELRKDDDDAKAD